MPSQVAAARADEAIVDALLQRGGCDVRDSHSFERERNNFAISHLLLRDCSSEGCTM